MTIHDLKYKTTKSEHFGRVETTTSSYLDEGLKGIKKIDDFPSIEKMIALKCDHVRDTGRGTLHLHPLYHFESGHRQHQEFALHFFGLDEVETEFLKSCPKTKVSGGMIDCSDDIRRAVAVIDGKIYQGSACGLKIGGAFESIHGIEE